MLQANPYGIFGFVAVAMCWALAVVLYRVGPAGSVARKLALLLGIEGVVLVTGGYIDVLFTPAATASSWYPLWGQVEMIVHIIGDCALFALYPPFLDAVLHTKLTRPFGRKGVGIGLAVVAAALFVTVLLAPPEIGVTLLYASMTSLFGFALVASIHAWYVTRPGIARTRAGIFALAFGFRDVCWGFIYSYGIQRILSGNMDAPEPLAHYIVYAAGTLLYVPIIAYGILRTQLFDIDLKIRWTIKQSTLAAIIVAFIFVISEGADRLLSAELGNWAGLLAAAVVVFFLAPLQSFAERIASVAMPNTENTPQYVAYRKMQVYEAALAEAQQEGGISDKERSLLNRLRDSLEISPADAETLERELQAGSPAPSF